MVVPCEGESFLEELIGRSGRCDTGSGDRQPGFILGSSSSWLCDLGLVTEPSRAFSFLICTMGVVVVPAS